MYKRVSGAELDQDSFVITLNDGDDTVKEFTINDSDVSISTDGADIIYAWTVPKDENLIAVGDPYTIVESGYNVPDHSVASEVSANGIETDGDTAAFTAQINDNTVYFTNTYTERTQLTVTKTVTGAVLGDGFKITVRDGDTVIAEKSVADAASETGSGDNKIYSWEITNENLIPGKSYIVEESGYDITGKIRTSSVAVNGDSAVSGTSASIVTAAGDNNTVAFTNTYEEPIDPGNLQAIKLLRKDGETENQPLTNYRFNFKAEAAQEESNGTYTVKSGETSITAENNTSGAIDFGSLGDLEPGTYYYILSEETGTDSSITYSNQKYLAKVEVEAQTISGSYFLPDTNSTKSNDEVKVVIPVDPNYVYWVNGKDYYPDDNGNVNLSLSVGAYQASVGQTTTVPFIVEQRGTHYELINENYAKIDVEIENDNWNVKVKGVMINLTDSNLSGGGDTNAGATTITYYELDASGEIMPIGDEGSDNPPTFVNTLNEEEPSAAHIELHKTDDKSPAQGIGGSKFKLLKGTGTPTLVAVAASGEGVTVCRIDDSDPQVTISDSIFTVPAGGISINGLDDGTYMLEEVEAPDGYIFTERYPVTFVVENGIVKQCTSGQLKSNASQDTADNSKFYVRNSAGAELPSAGGIGTTLFYIFGSVLLIGGGVLLVAKRRMEGNR